MTEGFGAWAVHWVVLKALMYLMGAPSAAPFLELAAYAGYPFVGVCLACLAKLTLGQNTLCQHSCSRRCPMHTTCDRHACATLACKDSYCQASRSGYRMVVCPLIGRAARYAGGVRVGSAPGEIGMVSTTKCCTHNRRFATPPLWARRRVGLQGGVGIWGVHSGHCAGAHNEAGDVL